MLKRVLQVLVTIGMLFLLQFILMGSHFKFQFKPTYLSFTSTIGIMLWNIILLYLFYRILIALTNRKVVSWLLLSAIMIIFSISNSLKIKYRSEPIIPNDLTMFKNLIDIIGYLTKPDIIISVVVIITVIILFGLTIIFNKQKVFNSNKVRIIHATVVFTISIIIFWGMNLENNFNKIGTSFGYNNQFWSMEFHFRTNGPLVGFFSIADVIAMDSMDYKEEDLEYLTDYKSTTGNYNYDDIVIYVLGESFIDPLRIKDLKINQDPIPYIRSIMNENTSGILYQSTTGGGTSKSEYEALTSFSNSFFHQSVSTPYQFPIPNLGSHPMIGDLFDRSVAIHTTHAKLYRRVEVFNKFGFDQFKYLDSPTDDLIYKDTIENHPKISDLSGFKEVIDTIDTISEDENAFIYFATVQNHTPYNKNFYSEVEFEIENNYAPDIKNQFEAYLRGLNETDKAMQYFIEEVNKYDRPITVVFFGDHYPPFAKEVVEVKENFKTDYFIYQNFSKTKLDYPLISTNFLSSIALKMLDIPKSPFYNFLDSMLDDYSVLHSNTIVRQNSTVFEPVDGIPEISDNYKRYKLLQYDIVSGKQYSIKNNYFKNKLD